MMDFSKIKLIIWDLDETFWTGVLSDGTAEFDNSNAKLIKNATDAGVINAICSKNDESDVERYMKEHGIWDLFVFNSINWSPKGDRVRQIISEMNLRDVNVLFIDDNHLNLQEVKEYCPNITCESPAIIPALSEYFDKADKKDLSHARLNQYKVLEKKKEFKASVGSNEEFLYNCNIHVNIHTDCANQLDRIYDLIQRSNQLNFTKIRSTEAELTELFVDSSVQCGYVDVNDKFGDYGIVGFYALKDDSLIHFVFSCRTLNMGIEQYVYNYLDRPSLTIVGEVASSLDGDTPKWINHCKNTVSEDKHNVVNTKVLLKGPCDLAAIFSFINESRNFVKEFVYINNKGVSVESGNHTTHIVESVTLDKATKDRLINSLPFGDEGMFQTALFDDDLGAVFLSMFTDPNLGLYKEKSSGAIVAFGEWTNDLTDEALWDKFINRELFDANCNFTQEQLMFIKDNFDFLGRITPEQIVENLDFIHSHIDSKTKLILNLGSEIEHKDNTQPAYDSRHLYNIELNKLIKEWKKDKANVYTVEVTKHINSQDDYTNNINHFVKPVYYKLALELVDILGNQKLKVRKRQKIDFVRKLKIRIAQIKREGFKKNK